MGLLFFWMSIIFFPSSNKILPPFCSSIADRGPRGALDLTELIGIPLPPSVSFVTGFEGYPAYSFGPEANVGRLTKSFIPDPFYHDFAITVTAKPTTRQGGVLFAITDAYQKVRTLFTTSLRCFLLPSRKILKLFYMFYVLQIVQLGVALSEVEDGSQRVVLYYTDAETRGRTQEAASFKMGDLTGRWARFTLTVQGSEVIKDVMLIISWCTLCYVKVGFGNLICNITSPCFLCGQAIWNWAVWLLCICASLHFVDKSNSFLHIDTIYKVDIPSRSESQAS